MNQNYPTPNRPWLALLILFLFSGYAPLFAQPCPNSNFVALFTQSDVDNFAVNYPDCDEITGTVFISNEFFVYTGSDSITNLNGLIGIKSIGKNLEVDNVGLLEDLSGLDNLESIGGVLWINENETLKSLHGLEGLTTIEGVIRITGNPSLENVNALSGLASFGNSDYEEFGPTQDPSLTYERGVVIVNGNSKLASLNGLLGSVTSIPGGLEIGYGGYTSLAGLDNITSIGNLYISYNHSLVSLDGLEQLTSITGAGAINAGAGAANGQATLFFYRNNMLEDLTALRNLTSSIDYLSIEQNNALASLSGLDNIDISNTYCTNVRIIDNPALSDCAIKSFCNWVDAIYGSFCWDLYNITPSLDNASGCNGVIEIRDQCTANSNSTGNWSDAVTWDNNYVPGSGTIVVINSGHAVSIQNSDDAVAKCLNFGNGGKLEINGTLTLTGNDPVQLVPEDCNSGSATICGTGTINGLIIPAPCGIIINPGNSPGIFHIDGDFDNMGGTLQIEIDGNTPGAGYDQLQVSGDATIGPDAQLQVDFGFLPAPTDVFDILLANSISGAFAPEHITITGIAYSSYDLSYPGGNTLRLSVTALPTPNCQDIPLALNASGQASLTPEMADPQAAPPTDPFTWSVSQTTFDCSDIGPAPVAVTLSVTDGVSTNSCTFNVSLQLEAECISGLVANLIDPGNGSGPLIYIWSTDILLTPFNCNNVTTTSPSEPWIFTCDDIGQNPVSATLTLDNGYSSTCQSTVIIENNIPLAISCPSEISVNTNEGSCEAEVTVPTPTVSGNCGTETLGNALHFDGTNDYVSFSSALLPTSPNAAWAVEAWIKTTTTEHDVLFSQYEVNTSLRSTIDIGNINSGKAGFWKKSAPGDGIIVQSTTSVNDGDWHHIAIVKEGAGAGQVHLYVDGVLEDSGTDAADMANTPTELGRINNTADGRYFPGELDEVRIWDIARNQTDIQAAMNQALAGNEPGLIAYYDFNQGVADSDNGSGCPGGAPCEDELTSLTGGNHGGLNGFALAGSTSNWVGSQELSTITFTNDFNNQSTLTDNFPLGATLVTWTATDAAGNSTSCTMSVTVNDNEAPAPDADPLPDIQVDCGAALTPPTATDNCAGPVTATNDDLLGAGTHIINWVYDDGNGNTSTQTQTVTITDDIPPVLTCQDITLQLDNNGQAALTPEMIAPGLSDNCGLPTTYLSHTLFDCSRLGGPGPNYALEFLEDRREYVQFISPFTGGADFTLETWFANDNQLGLDPSYLISWMDQSLEIYDEAGALFVRLGSTVAPLAALTRDGQWRHIAIVREGPSATVYLDGEEAWNGPTDVSLTDLFQLGRRFSTSTNGEGPWLGKADDLRFWNTARSAVQIQGNRFNPLQGTEASLAGYWPLNDGPGSSSAADLSPNIQHGALSLRLIHSDSWVSGAPLSSGNATTVLLTAGDAVGNASSCLATVSVEAGPMQARCRDIYVQLDENGQASISPEDVSFGSTASCSALSTAVSLADFTCEDVGINLVTLTVTDEDGATDDCTARVTVGQGFRLYGTGSLLGGSLFSMNLDGSDYVSYGMVDLTADQFGDNITSPNVIYAPDGFLYGTIPYGGTPVNQPWGSGALFRVRPDGTGFELLHDFEGGPDGYEPYFKASLYYDANCGSENFEDCFIYGTTRLGGNNYGTIFRYRPSDELYEVIHNFSTAISGGRPLSGITAGHDGYLYGLTGQFASKIYRFAPPPVGEQAEVEVVYHFTAGQGLPPENELQMGADGWLYGVGQTGGGGAGTLFRFNPETLAFEKIYTFQNAISGGRPRSAPIPLDNGFLYGTVSKNGTLGAGIVYRIRPDAPVPAATFEVFKEVQRTYAGLTYAPDGYLYGASFGYDNNYGSIFRLHPDDPDDFTIIHSFDGGPDDNPIGRPSNRLILVPTSCCEDDRFAPELTCPGILELIDLDGNGNEAITDLEALGFLAFDDCTEATMSISPEVFLLGSTEAVVTAVDEGGNMTTCQVTVIITGPCEGELEKIIAQTGGGVNEYFGHSVAIDGTRAIIGSYQDNVNGYQSGSAYIYQWDGSNWVEQQKLTASDGAAEDLFGHSVSISGDWALVGAYRDDDNGFDSGSAYIYRWDGSNWIEQQKFGASDGERFDYFGHSVSVSCDRAVIGALGDDSRSGSAYIYQWDGVSWVEQQKLIASDRVRYDYFSRSVSISGGRVIIGAYRDDDNGIASGSAYIYQWDGVSWAEQQKLTASDGAVGDWFGYSVSISGDQALVGACRDDDNGTSSGSAYVYQWDGESWAERQKLAASDGAAGDWFGASVAIEGETAIAGALNYGLSSGSAYLFHWDGFSLAEQEKLTAFDGEPGGHFGQSVAISRNRAIVGAYQNSNENGSAAGAAYPFLLGETGAAPVLSVTPPAPVCPEAPFDLSTLPVTDANNTGAVLTYHSGTPATAGNELPSPAVMPTSPSSTYYILGTSPAGCTDEVAVTLEAPAAPTFTCRNITVEIPPATGIAAVSPEDLASVTPDCGGYTLSFRDGSLLEFTCADIGQQLLALVYMTPEGGGRSRRCFATVTVEGALGEEVCDGIDNDCNGQIDEGFPAEVLVEEKLIAEDDEVVNDLVGTSVAISENWAIVGAWGEYEVDPGAAYFFQLEGSSWVQKQRVAPSGINGPIVAGGLEEQFGWSVAIDGEWAVIGASGFFQTTNNRYLTDGSVYVYHLEGGVWVETDKITADDGANIPYVNYFGYSVAINGDWIIAGAPVDNLDDLDIGFSFGYGSAYIFHRNGTEWTQYDKITADVPAAGEQFGSSVSIDGDWAIVGAKGNRAHGNESGSAYLFQWNGTEWAYYDKIFADTPAAGERFGHSVSLSAISGNECRAIVGTEQGEAAYLFHWDGNNWAPQLPKLTAPGGQNGDYFGYSVSISGDMALAGAYGSDNLTGAVYPFQWNGNEWLGLPRVTAGEPDAEEWDVFGYSVHNNGDKVIIGAPGDDEGGADSGAAYISATVPCSGAMRPAQPPVLPPVAGAAEAKSDFTLYPNPALEEIFLEFNTPLASAAEVRLYDLAGRPVLRRALEEGTDWIGIPIEEMAPGLYLVEVKSGERVFEAKRFVKGGD